QTLPPHPDTAFLVRRQSQLFLPFLPRSEFSTNLPPIRRSATQRNSLIAASARPTAIRILERESSITSSFGALQYKSRNRETHRLLFPFLKSTAASSSCAAALNSASSLPRALSYKRRQDVIEESGRNKRSGAVSGISPTIQ